MKSFKAKLCFSAKVGKLYRLIGLRCSYNLNVRARDIWDLAMSKIKMLQIDGDNKRNSKEITLIRIWLVYLSRMLFVIFLTHISYPYLFFYKITFLAIYKRQGSFTSFSKPSFQKDNEHDGQKFFFFSNNVWLLTSYLASL